MSKIPVSDFALNHDCDEFWVDSMNDRATPVFQEGQLGKYRGRDVVIVKHDRNAMWVIRFIDVLQQVVNGEDIDCCQSN